MPVIPVDRFITRHIQLRHMDGDLILSTVIFLFVIFIFIVPPLLYTGLKRIRNPVPPFLPALFSVLVIAMLTAIRKLPLISNENVMAGTIVMFTLLLLLVDLAVITPFPYFEKKIGVSKPWMVFTLVAFVGAFLLFYTTAGDVYTGRPMPAFAGPLPLTGWALDGATSTLGLEAIVYAFGSPFYELLREIGLWLEVLIVAVAYYGVLAILPKPEPAE